MPAPAIPLIYWGIGAGAAALGWGAYKAGEGIEAGLEEGVSDGVKIALLGGVSYLVLREVLK